MADDLTAEDFPLPTPIFPSLDPTDMRVFYDREGDILGVLFGPTHPATSVDIDGEYWLRMDPETGQVYGIEVEGFEIGYLKRHPDVARIWVEIGRQESRQFSLAERSAFVEWIRRIFADLKRQQWQPSPAGS